MQEVSGSIPLGSTNQQRSVTRSNGVGQTAASDHQPRPAAGRMIFAERLPSYFSTIAEPRAAQATQSAYVLT
jgi:hypothetical protein